MSSTQHIWFDGELRPFEDATVHILTHTLHYGLGIFEGIRAYSIGGGLGAVFRLEDHCRRFTDTARILGLPLPLSSDDLAAAIMTTLEANGEDEAYVRPFSYLGRGPMDVVSSANEVHTTISTWHWGAYLGEEGLRRGIRCHVSSFTRIGLSDHLPKGKISGHYVNSILAKDESRRLGFDEALMMDRDGHVLEGSSENLFLVRRGVLVTPPLDTSILGGITRDTVIALARDMGLPVEEALFGRDSLYLADEVFLTGTAAEVTPVREVDGRTIGDGAPGETTRALQRRYREVVTADTTDHAAWRTRFAPRRQLAVSAR